MIKLVIINLIISNALMAIYYGTARQPDKVGWHLFLCGMGLNALMK